MMSWFCCRFDFGAKLTGADFLASWLSYLWFFSHFRLLQLKNQARRQNYYSSHHPQASYCTSPLDPRHGSVTQLTARRCPARSEPDDDQASKTVERRTEKKLKNMSRVWSLDSGVWTLKTRKLGVTGAAELSGRIRVQSLTPMPWNHWNGLLMR